LSPAWVGTATPHSTGRQWHRLRFTELAVCHAGELPWGTVRRVAA
jgi:hypothetical protein